MYDDDDNDNGGGSGLGGAVWYQLGRWAEQSAQEEHRFLDNLRARFARTFQRPEGRIYIDDYNNLMAWYRRALKLEKQVEELQARIRQDRDAAASMTELFLVEKDLRKLAEQGLTGVDEYVELSELQSAAEDEFMLTGKFDADAHRHRTIDVASRLRSKIRD